MRRKERKYVTTAQEKWDITAFVLSAEEREVEEGSVKLGADGD